MRISSTLKRLIGLTIAINLMIGAMATYYVVVGPTRTPEMVRVTWWLTQTIPNVSLWWNALLGIAWLAILIIFCGVLPEWLIAVENKSLSSQIFMGTIFGLFYGLIIGVAHGLGIDLGTTLTASFFLSLLGALVIFGGMALTVGVDPEIYYGLGCGVGFWLGFTCGLSLAYGLITILVVVVVVVASKHKSSLRKSDT